MNRALWTRRRVAALLAGLLVALTAIGPVQAYEPVLDPDLAFVPPNATAFCTVRAADLAGKLGINEGPGKHPWAVAWKKQVGIPLNHVERCTFVDSGNGQVCLILLTNSPFKRGDVLKACVPDAKQAKVQGKVCHVSPTTSTTVHFASDRILLIGDKDAVTDCLSVGQSGVNTSRLFLLSDTNEVVESPGVDNAKCARSVQLTEALTRTAKHDLVIWCSATQAHANTACYKPLFRAKAKSGKTVTVARKPNLYTDEVPPPASVSEPKKTLGRTSLPMPAGIEAGTFVLDLGDKMNIEMRLDCDQEATAKKTEKLLRALVELTRGQLLTVLAIDAFPEVAEGADLKGLPIKLIRQGEKGLQNAEYRTDGKTGIVSIAIPVDAKMLRSEMKGLMKMSEACGLSDAGLPLPFVKTTVPSSSLPPPPASWVPAQDAAVNPAYPPAPVTVPVPTPINPPQSIRPPSAPSPSVQQAPCIAPPAQLVKLTVANVRKETAVLFLIDDNGKMTFAQKVLAGDAADLQMACGQRLIAVFTENPGVETFIAKQATETWLLRSQVPLPSPLGCTTGY